MELARKAQEFFRAEASRDNLKFRVSEMVFPGVFRRYFPPQMPCCFVRIHARLGKMPSKCQGVPQNHMIRTFHIDLNLFKYVFSVIQNW